MNPSKPCDASVPILQCGNAAKENHYFQLGDIIVNLFCVNCHQCLADKKWQLFVVVCTGKRATDRERCNTCLDDVSLSV